MEPDGGNLYIGDRLSYFQAAAGCLSIVPKLKRAGRFCVIAGGVGIILILAARASATSPFLWACLVLFGFDVYLYLPNPQPWALPAAGLVILAVLADGIYVEYQQWSRFHIAPQGDGVGVIIEVVLAVSLFGSYMSYKRSLAATDADTLAKLREIALAVNKSNLEQHSEIVELTQKNSRLRLRRLDRFVLIVVRHYIAFGVYSKLDAVAIEKPEAVVLSANGIPKLGRPVKLHFSAPGLKSLDVKLPPQYISRVLDLGVTTTGMIMLETGSDTPKTLRSGNV